MEKASENAAREMVSQLCVHGLYNEVKGEE